MRQDLQDSQDCSLKFSYPVNLVNPVKKYIFVASWLRGKIL